MRIGKIASSAEYRMDKQFQNLLIFKNLLIFQFRKFLKFLISKVPKILN